MEKFSSTINYPQIKVQDIGEKGLLKLLQPFCLRNIVGDDGAVIPWKQAESLVITTDMLVDGVHFSDRTTPPEAAGWRAAAANLSDLAAMGAKPVGITIALGLRGEVEVSWVKRLYQGISDCLQAHNSGILGGDICRSSVVSVAITAFGQVLPQQVICRSGAQVGDAIMVTGFHGDSRAGLELLLNRDLGQNLSTQEREWLIKAHQYPQPRLDVLNHLQKLQPDSAVAGMDSSDGLADAILQICQSSGVGAVIDAATIPKSPALSKLVSPSEAQKWALYGGEDFELVLCLPSLVAAKLTAILGEGAAVIGTVTSVKEVQLVNTQGNNSEQKLTLEQGFQHF